MKRFLIALGALLVCLPALAQQPSTDTQLLRSLLDEVKQLRRDLQTTSVATQRVQIVLYRLQLQDAAVARASRTAQDAQEHLAAIRSNRQRMSEQMQRLEEDETQEPARRVEYEEARKQIKLELDRQTKDEQQWQSRSSDAEAQLRAEQEKLDSLHSLLDELDQALQNVGRK